MINQMVFQMAAKMFDGFFIERVFGDAVLYAHSPVPGTYLPVRS